jgi:hypothetical protein
VIDGDAVSTGRDLVESVVHDRARHDTKDKIGDTRSFANMEQTLPAACRGERIGPG